MIFYKALKYKILEYCLESLCERISTNFILLNERIVVAKNLRVGMFCKRMERTEGTSRRWYSNCKITSFGYQETVADMSCGRPRKLMYISMNCTDMYDMWRGARAIKSANFTLYEDELVKLYD